MSAEHSTAARDAMAKATLSLLDAGTALPRNGWAEFRDIDGSVIGRCRLSLPAFGPVQDGGAAANPIEPETSAAGGTVRTLLLLDSDENEVVSCPVGKKGEKAPLELDEVDVRRGQTILIDNLYYEAPL